MENALFRASEPEPEAWRPSLVRLATVQPVLTLKDIYKDLRWHNSQVFKMERSGKK